MMNCNNVFSLNSALWFWSGEQVTSPGVTFGDHLPDVTHAIQNSFLHLAKQTLDISISDHLSCAW